MSRAGPWLAALVTAALAVGVAAAIKRPPPDFARLPVVAVIADDAGRPLWTIRLAPVAHEIAADATAAVAVPAGHAYQLWLRTPQGPQSLGLLPGAGRKIIPEIPARCADLARPGGLIVTLEKARGSERRAPDGPVRFRASLRGLR